MSEHELKNALAEVVARGIQFESSVFDVDGKRQRHPSIVLDAMQYVAEKHAGQKYSGVLPFVVHPYAVMTVVQGNLPWWVLKDLHSSDMLISALSHDVIEDTDATQPDLEYRYGSYVGNTVWDLTDTPGPRKQRREQMARKLFGKRDAQFIKSADVYVNMAFSYETDRLGYTDSKWGMYAKEYAETKAALPFGSRYLFDQLDKLVIGG